MRRFFFLLLFGLSAPGLRAETAEPLSLDQVLTWTLEKNPDIAASRQAWKAAEARIAPSRAWPDPMVSLSREKFPAGDRTNHLKLEQGIPFPGKLRAEGAMNHHEARIAESRHRAATLRALAEA